VLREIFVPKTEEMIGGCRKLDNEEIHNLYSLANIQATEDETGGGWDGGGGGGNIGYGLQKRDRNTKYVLI
jgi:hypothetical protein